MSELRSALVVAVPEVTPVIEEWRERTCLDKLSIGIPAHLTILFPFVPPGRIGEPELDRLVRLLARFDPFRFELRETDRFPGLLYLAPVPSEPVVALIDGVLDEYPDYPPYGGEVSRASIVPHVTIAYGDAAVLAEAETEIAASLPIESEAREVLLLEEVEADCGRWRTSARLPLGSPWGVHRVLS